jgi:hypothetical protein
MGKFRSNIVRKGKPPKTEAEYEAEARAKMERMVILSNRVRKGTPKVSLAKMSWEVGE